MKAWQGEVADSLARPPGAALHAACGDHEDDPARLAASQVVRGGRGRPNDRYYLEVEVPAGNGVGTARAIARAYSALAEGGAELGITPETFARVTTPPQVERAKDEVLGVPSYFSLGFLRPGPNVWFGSSQRAFGSPGAGGSFAFADPDARVGYAYVMNKLDFYLENDPREKALRDAVYRALARLTNLRDVPKVHAAPQRTAR